MPKDDRLRGYAFGLLVCAVYFLVSLGLTNYPHWPNDYIGWLLVAVLGIPLALSGEYLAGILLGDRISRRLSPKKFSGLRILYALLLALVAIGIALAVWRVAGDAVRPHFTSSPWAWSVW